MGGHDTRELLRLLNVYIEAKQDEHSHPSVLDQLESAKDIIQDDISHIDQLTEESIAADVAADMPRHNSDDDDY